MKINEFGQVVISEQDIFRGLYSGKITNLSELNIEDALLVNKFNSAKSENADPFTALSVFLSPSENIQDFDAKNQNNWLMPESYKNMDITKWLIEQCKTPEELERTSEELLLFAQHNMIEVLKYLKYLVDTMRQNRILWGVGRGSSVASYCLYLIGIHKINSMKYNLDIHEFLR